MAKALRLARRGLYSTTPNPRVGCVVVKQGEFLAEGWHVYAGGAHAEINAISQLDIPPGCDFYITLEPCSHQGRTPPCVDALIKLQPTSVIIAMQDPNPLVAGASIKKLRAANIEVVCGVLEDQARKLNAGFIARFEKQRPFLRLKMASSLDGRTALQNGKSEWVTGAAARRDVQFLRARSCAILTTAATVLADNPSLDVRLSAAELGQDRDVRQPVCVVIDRELRLSGKEKIFSKAGAVWIITQNADKNKHQPLITAGADITVLEGNASKGDQGKLDLLQLMQHLASREINEVHCECGQILAGALLQQGLVDELVIYMAPKLLGSQARGLFEIGELTDMDSSVNLQLKQLSVVGEDLRLHLIPEQN